MRRLSHVVATVTSVATMTLAAGCGGDNPAPSATPTRSVPTSSSPTETPPIAPGALTQKNKRGAIEAVRYFLEAMRFAGSTGEVAAFRETFSASCTKCAAIADGIERTYAAGGSIEGGAWEPKRFKFYAIERDVASVDAVVDYTAQTFVPKRGAPSAQAPRQEGVLKAFQVTWDGQWRVGALDPTA